MKLQITYKMYWFFINLRRTNKPARIFIETAVFLYYVFFRRGNTFNFQGKKYKYFYHLYNRTIGSERIVEIPIAYKILNDFKSKNILEVGNVLSHYFFINHDVLDKYEKAKFVINKDVANFTLRKKYDLILTVSTMEHVGWTYGEKVDPGKFLRGITNLKKHLAKNGMLLVTFPLYYRNDLSKLIISGKMPFKEEYFMKRTSFWNEWIEVGLKDAVKGNAYDKYFANANILYIGIFKN